MKQQHLLKLKQHASPSERRKLFGERGAMFSRTKDGNPVPSRSSINKWNNAASRQPATQKQSADIRCLKETYYENKPGVRDTQQIKMFLVAVHGRWDQSCRQRGQKNPKNLHYRCTLWTFLSAKSFFKLSGFSWQALALLSQFCFIDLLWDLFLLCKPCVSFWFADCSGNSAVIFEPWIINIC